MPFASIFSIAAPLTGLVALLVVVRVPRLRPYGRFAVPAAAGLSLIGVLFAPLEPTRVLILARWQPSVFFGAFPALLAGPGVWPLALAFSCAVVASALVQVGRVAEPRFTLDISMLGMLAAGLAGLWGENLLMLLAAWASFDLAWGLGGLATGLAAPKVTMGAAVNGLASVALWAGALAVEGGGGLSWRLMDPSGLGCNLLMVAALLRLGVYPLHLTLSAEEGQRLPGALPQLLGPILGWGLLVRLAAGGCAALAAGGWWEGLAAVTYVGGGLLAWTRAGRGKGWPWMSLAAVGAVLWAAQRAGEAAAPVVLAIGGAAWVLGITLMYLGRGYDRAAPWWSVASAVGGLALLGAVPTLGVVPAAFLAGSLVAPFSVWRSLVFLLGQGLLSAAVARRVLRAAPAEESAGPLHVAARGAGLALPAALLVVGGIHPALLLPVAEGLSLVQLLTRPGIVAWGLWLAGVAAGGALFWVGPRFRRRLGVVPGLVHDFLRLEWALRLVLDGLASVSTFLGAVADVAEGPGAILWALATFFLVIVALMGR